MNITASKNEINNLRDLLISNSVTLDLEGEQKVGYDLYLTLQQHISEESHKCIGCPVVRRCYRLSQEFGDEYYSAEQRECVDNPIECVQFIHELESFEHIYRKLLNIVDRMENVCEK